MKRVVRNGFDSLADDHLFNLALVLTPRRAKHISLAADGQGTIRGQRPFHQLAVV